jgi:glycosyltransferase involved in cell wall biosynthesis
LTKRLLVLSQVYVPDPTAVGQYMHDASAALVQRGVPVRVLASAHDYNEPRITFPKREVRDGVEIRRIGWSHFGKRSLVIRLIGHLTFLAQCSVRALFMRDVAGVLVSTSPPMASFAGLLISKVTGVPLVYWVMDLNPDQLIMMKVVTPASRRVRLYERFNRAVLRRARAVIALDHFMAERILKKLDVRPKLHVLPPWPLAAHRDAVARERNEFRRAHGAGDRIVVMYSGNHTPLSPLQTFMDAALQLRDDDRFLFMFVGGGVGKAAIDRVLAREKPANIVSLPYQPLEGINASLAAADVHVVTLGDEEVGIRHPSKIYGALALGRPVLSFGTEQSFVGELMHEHGVGWHVEHGDVAAAVAVLKRIAGMSDAERAAFGERAKALIQQEYEREALLTQFCTIVENAVSRVSGADAVAPVRSRVE